MKLDFNYKKIIILKYDFGGGGRFLINSLGLSEDSVFLCPKITNLQLIRKFPPERKLLYLLATLKRCRNTNTWDELNLIDKNFWGISDHDFFVMNEDDIINYNYSDTIFKSIQKNKFIFLSTHEDEYIKKLRNCWKNSKYIIFKNENIFKESRNNIIENKNSDKYFKIKSKLNLNILGETSKNYDYVWDSSWYFSEEITIKKIKELYDKFEIPGFNQNLISKYYNAWIDTIF
jgi:hypothetical protein